MILCLQEKNIFYWSFNSENSWSSEIQLKLDSLVNHLAATTIFLHDSLSAREEYLFIEVLIAKIVGQAKFS